MRRSTNPDTIRSNLWRDKNPDKAEKRKIIDAYNLLVRVGVIAGDRVVYNPRER